jgi:hypothetical protein
MAIYEHVCFACSGFFEEIYSYRDAPPTICSLCGVDGQVKRIPSLPARGRVPLTGQDLKKQTFKEAQDLKREMATNETLRANLIGEDKYNENVSRHDADMKDVPKNMKNIADKFRP